MYGNSTTARDGDACDGYIDGTTHVNGVLARCEVCSDDQQFLGLEGAACSGFRSDRSRAEGLVDCDNLRAQCSLMSNTRACDEVRERGRRAR